MDSIAQARKQGTPASSSEVASSRSRDNAFSLREGAQTGKPVGGFAFIPASELVRAWDCYDTGQVELRDLRVWFAAHEQLARRTVSQLDEERLPHFTEIELRRMVGGKPVRASLRRLEASKLLTWSKSSLRFPNATKARHDALPGLCERLSRIKNQARLVPVPRTWIRLMAQTGTSAVIAVFVGLMLQGLYYRDGECVAWGRVKSSWMARLFGLDLRNIKRARRHLCELGILADVPDEHWKRQRWGGAFSLNLQWSRPQGYVVPSLPPRPPEKTPALPPPVSDRNLPSEIKNQNLGSARPAGVSNLGREEKTKSEIIAAPTWRHVERCDLVNTTRLLDLFDQAAKKGDVSHSEHGRLLFITAAEHALCRGTLNAPGLFVHLVRKKLWHYCTQEDEDAARNRIKREVFGLRPERPVAPKPVKPKVITLSHEQKLAQAIARVCDQKRLTPMLVIRSMKLDWTLERFHQLQEELDNIRLQSQVSAKEKGAEDVR